MRLIDLRLAPWLRRSLYTALAIAWSSGTAFYVLRRWLQAEGEFGPVAHPWQHPMLELHGALASIMTALIGAMALAHLPPAWRSRRSRGHGLVLASLLACMWITAWCLYYVDNDTARAWIANLHVCTGLILPIALWWHIRRGRMARRQMQRNAGALATSRSRARTQ